MDENIISQKDEQIAEQTKASAQKDEQIAELMRSAAQKDEENA